MRIVPLICGVALLTACTNPPPQPLDPAGFVPLDYEAPLALRALLPRGVPPSDLREEDGCYGYVLDGQIFPVQRPDGGQYCIG